jgi:hypothetical protein
MKTDSANRALKDTSCGDMRGRTCAGERSSGAFVYIGVGEEQRGCIMEAGRRKPLA